MAEAEAAPPELYDLIGAQDWAHEALAVFEAQDVAELWAIAAPTMSVPGPLQKRVATDVADVRQARCDGGDAWHRHRDGACPRAVAKGELIVPHGEHEPRRVGEAADHEPLDQCADDDTRGHADDGGLAPVPPLLLVRAAARPPPRVPMAP